jgi:nucleoid DNA-binding protein
MAAKKRKVTATKKVVKKTTAKKVVKSTKVVAPKKLSVGSKAFTKSQFMGAIAEQTGLARKDVAKVLTVVSDVIALHVQKRGPGVFSWPGLFKMKVVNKPATKSRKGVNPFTGEPMVFKAKPASRKVKILALKQLKGMVSD